ncbi:MAG TPA: NIPSNAP family protein [Bryobacteraceae bacterium]|nr:NIPSNAP family protein [Bryobacteraceae bacterium]
MDRRQFLASSCSASALAAGSLKAAPQAAGKAREYYELRRYQLQSGPQRPLADAYFRDALIPGLNRLGISPVGVFSIDVGEGSPSLYVLIPSASIETLINATFRLEQDAEYLKAGAPFLNAPAKQPAYARMESSLMLAFEGFSKLTIPPATAEHRARVFELRTYESPTDQDHKRKVEMFNSGEFDVFEKAGFWQVFYGDTVVGSRMPNLTYMIGFPDIEARAKMWKAFGAEPGWKKLSGSPRYNFEEIVSNITNVILSPTAYSQI